MLPNSPESVPETQSARPTSWLGVAVRVVITDNQGRMLLLKRPEDCRFPGQWEFPGGKSDPGETPDVSCVRETLEETGLTIAVDHLVGAVEGRLDDKRTINIAMTGRITGGSLALSGEHVEYLWLDAGDILNRDVTDVTRDILHLLRTAGGNAQ